MTQLLFPADPLSARRVEPDFSSERDAARAAGFETALIDYERLAKGDAAGATLRVGAEAGPAVYRGWMLKPERYGALHAHLATQGVELVTTPSAYRTCHYLPDAYAFIQDCSPKSAWMEVAGALDVAALARLAEPFGSNALVVKDYVKSQKHYWDEACFVPNAGDTAQLERVVRRFLELQGEDLNVGLVLREYVPLEIVGTHPKSGAPLAAEFRTFWYDGELVLSHRYWGDLTRLERELPLVELNRVAARVPSRFFSMDVAFTRDGGWVVVELGDAQVSGLPSIELAPSFYRALQERCGS